MKRIILFVFGCTLSSAQLFAQLAPDILIPDPKEERTPPTSGDAAVIEDIVDEEKMPKSNVMDFGVNWRDEFSTRKMKFDEDSLNAALAIAANDRGNTGNPFTLIVQLQSLPTPEEERRMQDSGQTLQEVRRTQLEDAFSSPEGHRALYNPNYPILGQVLSIPVDPKDLEEWIVRIPREIPQASKVLAEQNSYVLQPSQHDGDTSAVRSSRIETVRHTDEPGAALQGQPLCEIGRNRLQILIPGGVDRLDARVPDNSEAGTTSGEWKSHRRQTSPDTIELTGRTDISEWFVILRSTSSREEIENQIQQLGGLVSSASSRQVAFRCNSDIVEKLREAGLRPIKKPR